MRGTVHPGEGAGEVVGAVLRTRNGVRPLFVSPGHLVRLEDAIDIVLHCSTRYRVPEPLRLADSIASFHPETPDVKLLVSDSERRDFSSWQGNRGVARRRT